MKQIEIIVVCKHEEILKTIARLINTDPSLNATTANTLEQAITILKSAYFDLVLVGSGLSADEEAELSAIVQNMRQNIPVVFHYGGGSGLLFTEIRQALKTK